ncbi:MAG: ATP synthase F0 subunit B [Proteobacteria bacterium]|nr:ATP synthase F0 subunit B [Pseudomonadota bacterium]
MESTLTLLGISGKLLLLQAVPFLLAVAGLHFIIFKPMLAMLAERERNITGFRKEAELLQEEVAGKLAELEERLAAARGEAAAERGRLRTEAAAAEQEILAAARGRAEAHLEEARATLAAEHAAASVQLEAHAAELSRSVASSVLGRQIGEG